MFISYLGAYLGRYLVNYIVVWLLIVLVLGFSRRNAEIVLLLDYAHHSCRLMSNKLYI